MTPTRRRCGASTSGCRKRRGGPGGGACWRGSCGGSICFGRDEWTTGGRRRPGRTCGGRRKLWPQRRRRSGVRGKRCRLEKSEREVVLFLAAPGPFGILFGVEERLSHVSRGQRGTSVMTSSVA